MCIVHAAAADFVDFTKLLPVISGYSGAVQASTNLLSNYTY